MNHGPKKSPNSTQKLRITINQLHLFILPCFAEQCFLFNYNGCYCNLKYSNCPDCQPASEAIISPYTFLLFVFLWRTKSRDKWIYVHCTSTTSSTLIYKLAEWLIYFDLKCQISWINIQLLSYITADVQHFHRISYFISNKFSISSNLY